MFFRSYYAKTFKGAGSAGPQSMLSKQAGRAWAGLSPAEKKEYKDMERIDKLVHKAMYPDYVYSPRRTTYPKAKGSSGRRKHKRSSSSSTSSDNSDPSDILVSNSRSPFQRDLVDDQAVRFLFLSLIPAADTSNLPDRFFVSMIYFPISWNRSPRLLLFLNLEWAITSAGEPTQRMNFRQIIWLHLKQLVSCAG